MKRPRDTVGAVRALEDLVDHLREKGVRSFKGELLGEDGQPVWHLEMTFEKPVERPPADRSPME